MAKLPGVRVSNMPADASLDGSELVYIINGGVSSRCTVQQIWDGVTSAIGDLDDAVELARKWASEDVDVPVETSPSNVYSALHYAHYADLYAQAAQAAQNLALAYRNQAQNFRNAAEGFADEAEGYRDEAADILEDTLTETEADGRYLRPGTESGRGITHDGTVIVENTRKIPIITGNGEQGASGAHVLEDDTISPSAAWRPGRQSVNSAHPYQSPRPKNTTENYESRRNIWEQTEGISELIYKQGTVTVTGENITVDGIRLDRCVFTENFAYLALDLLSPVRPFVAGKRYLISFYVIFEGLLSGDNWTNLDTSEWSFWMRQNVQGGPSTRGEGSRYCDKQMRRVSYLIEAETDNDVFDRSAYSDFSMTGGTATARPRVLFPGALLNNRSAAFWVGGFQVEQVDDDALDGVLWFGDSTVDMYGYATTQFGTPRYFEMLRNCTSYDASEGGRNSDQLLNEYYQTQALPKQQAGTSKYCVVQAGLCNSIANGLTLEKMQGDVRAIVGAVKSEASLGYAAGGTYQIQIGDTITGATSGATAVVSAVGVLTGDWASGDASGMLYLIDVSGAFEAEELNVGANSGVATITEDAVAHNPMIPVLMTATGSESYAAAPDGEANHLAINKWILQNYPLVIDAHRFLQDWANDNLNNKNTIWYGDGVHYTQEAKKALAEYAANLNFWELPEPTPYQPIIASDWQPKPNLIADKYSFKNQSSAPADPANGFAAMFTNAAGDLQIKLNDGAATKTVDVVKYNQPVAVSTVATGTAYTLTAAPAAIDFGTTDPVITIPTDGKYVLLARAAVRANAATLSSGQSLTLRGRRTNNTPTNVASMTTNIVLRSVTSASETLGVFDLPPVVYEGSVGDTITINAWLSANPDAGDVEIYECIITAIPTL